MRKLYYNNYGGHIERRVKLNFNGLVHIKICDRGWLNLDSPRGVERDQIDNDNTGESRHERWKPCVDALVRSRADTEISTVEFLHIHLEAMVVAGGVEAVVGNPRICPGDGEVNLIQNQDFGRRKFEFWSENVDLGVFDIAEFKFLGLEMRFERN